MLKKKRLLAGLVVIVLFAWFMKGWLSDNYVVPILMYHNVENTEVRRADTVSPEIFEQHMSYLKKNGYHVLTFDELIEGIKSGQNFSKKSVVLTFDDGYENNFTHAFPVLQKYHFPATFYISPALINQTGFLTWKQLLQMKGKGITFASHGMTHAYLPDSTEEDRIFEIAESKRRLSETLDVPVDYFSYPVGGFDKDVKDKIQQAGYKSAVTTNRGVDRFNQDVYELNRIRLSDKDHSWFYVWVKLTGYYNSFRKMKNPY